MIATHDNFLDLDTCNYLTDLIKNNNEWGKINHPFWVNRVMSFSSLKQCDKELISDIKNRITNFIKEAYELNAIYCNTIDIVKWEPGWEQPPHMDACEGLEFRDLGSVIYLNNTFTGGQTYYVGKKIDVKPSIGKLVVHPGAKEYTHGVTKITDGTRYTVASFWSRQEDKEMSFSGVK